MGLITSLAIGFIVFLAVQYFAPSLSIWVAIFVAGFIAGILAEGILKGLFVGLVIAVIGIFIAVYFLGGIPGISGNNFNDVINSMMGIVGGGIAIMAAVAAMAGGALRRYKFKK